MRRLRVYVLSLVCLALPCFTGPTSETPCDRVIFEDGAPAGVTGTESTPVSEPEATGGVVLVPFDRLVDGGRAPVVFCFAPGTDPEVMAYYDQLMHTPPDGERYYLAGRWSGAQGSHRALTWSLVPDGLAVDGGTSELFARMDSLFGGNRALWIAQLQASFARWAALIGTSYTRITYGGNDWDDGASWGSAGSGTRGDIRIAMIYMDGSSGVLAYNYYPSNGDMVLDRSEGWSSASSNYRFLRDVVMHEHGHGIGMNHVCSTDSKQLLEPYLDTSIDGPQDDDVRGGQRHYGDIYEANDTAGTATNLGTAMIGSPITLGDNIPSPTIPYGSMLTLDADGEADYFRFATTGARAASVTITPVGRTYDNSPQTCGGGGDCCTGNPVNSLTVANLNVQVIDSDGSTVLATADTQPAGVAETVAGLYLPLAGTYYIRVYESGSPTQAQFYRLTLTVTELDCNDNGIVDPCDLSCVPPGCDVPGCGLSLDCNANGLPDECELGPNDCNNNSVPDDCDVAHGTSEDCQPDGTPDECQVVGDDCNGNNIPDDCDIAYGTSVDCQPNGTPDECEIAGHDCNTNGTMDVCDIAGATSEDCQPNGTPDECELAGNDCNANSTPDECESDCNTNGIPDQCDLTAATSNDCNTNGIPDECDALRCYSVWDGFQPNPPFSYGRPVSQIDYDGDGVYWTNPKGTATISPIGCETQEFTDNAVHVTVPSTGNPQEGYVSSEYFRTAGGSLPPDEHVYLLSFRPKLEQSLNPKTDWQFFIYDAVNQKEVIQIQFASTVSGLVGAADRGYVVVKNPAGSPTFLSTGVQMSLYTCYDFKVVLNNFDGTVELYIDDMVTPKVSTVPLNPAARRMDYFRLQAVSNGASSTGTTVFALDYFNLCLTGSKAPPGQFPDCNANDVLDECDIAAGTSVDCNASTIPDECEGGDFDGDGDVDLLDYRVFEGCITGPCVSPPCDPPLYAGLPGPCCALGDADQNGAIDTSDFAGFQGAFTGTP
ncbi:MAG: matrixin family metalloprotease [Planctomycetota bacterium]